MHGLTQLVIGSVGGVGELNVSHGGTVILDSGASGAGVGSVARARIGASVDDFYFTAAGLPSLAGAPSEGTLRVDGVASNLNIRADVAELIVAELLPRLIGLPEEAQQEVIEGRVEVTNGGRISLVSPSGHARALLANGAGTSASLTIAGAGSLLDAGQMLVAGYAETPTDGTDPSGLGGSAALNVSDGGTLRAERIFLGQNVVLGGDGGVVDADLWNSGTIAPGSSPGVLEILGDLTLLPDSRVVIEIAGTSAGTEYDVLRVGGELALAGILEVVYLNGFLPAVGDLFAIFDAATITGRFDSVVLPRGENRSFSLVDGMLFARPSVSTVPAPTALTMLFAALMSITALRGRKVRR